jgi:D-alanine-D-alanine ligase
MSLIGKKIGVLMGGLSKERDVSLRSGQAVAKALRARGHDVVDIDVDRDVATRLKNEKIEIAFLVLHGRYGEDGTLQGLLEVLGIPYTGSGVLPSAIGMDKDLTKRLLAPIGICVANWVAVRRKKIQDVPRSPFALPVVIKPNQEGSTIGISIVREEKDFLPALMEAAKLDDVVLIEQFISGTEVTVAVIDGQAFPIVEIAPKSGFYDYTSKYTKGLTDYIVPARISDSVRDELQKKSERIWNLLNLEGYARMDYIVAPSGDEDYFLEVNTTPGMTETSLVPKAAAQAGLSFEDVCEKILATASLKVKAT